MTNSKYGKILAIATTVCVVLLGLLFIICCAHLYFTGGDSPYSRERVGEYLIVLAVPSIITVALAICSMIYAYVTGVKDDELTGRTSGELLESFSARYDFKSFDEKTQNQVQEIRKRKNIVDFVASEISAFCLVFVLDYLIFIADFSVENMNADIMSAFAVILPLSAIAVAIHIPRIYISEKSAAEELSLLKASVKEHGAPALAKKSATEKKAGYIDIVRYVIVGASVVLLVLGIINGGMADVLQKAVKICTECIGLG